MDPPRCDGITDNVISPRLHGRGDLFREEEMETELDIDELLAAGAGARRLSKEERQALLTDVREALAWMDDNEPARRTGEAYETWCECHEDLEDLAEDLEDLL